MIHSIRDSRKSDPRTSFQRGPNFSGENKNQSDTESRFWFFSRWRDKAKEDKRRPQRPQRPQRPEVLTQVSSQQEKAKLMIPNEGKHGLLSPRRSRYGKWSQACGTIKVRKAKQAMCDPSLLFNLGQFKKTGHNAGYTALVMTCRGSIVCLVAPRLSQLTLCVVSYFSIVTHKVSEFFHCSSFPWQLNHWTSRRRIRLCQDNVNEFETFNGHLDICVCRHGMWHLMCSNIKGNRGSLASAPINT